MNTMCPGGTVSTARVFERNDRLVIEAFQRGEFDFLEGVGEISETDFFRAIAEKKVLKKLATAYPYDGAHLLQELCSLPESA